MLRQDFFAQYISIRVTGDIVFVVFGAADTDAFGGWVGAIGVGVGVGLGRASTASVPGTMHPVNRLRR